jgi:hypothetical protein
MARYYATTSYLSGSGNTNVDKVIDTYGVKSGNKWNGVARCLYQGLPPFGSNRLTEQGHRNRSYQPPVICRFDSIFHISYITRSKLSIEEINQEKSKAKGKDNFYN